MLTPISSTMYVLHAPSTDGKGQDPVIANTPSGPLTFWFADLESASLFAAKDSKLSAMMPSPMPIQGFDAQIEFALGLVAMGYGMGLMNPVRGHELDSLFALADYIEEIKRRKKRLEGLN